MGKKRGKPTAMGPKGEPTSSNVGGTERSLNTHYAETRFHYYAHVPFTRPPFHPHWQAARSGSPSAVSLFFLPF